MNGRSQRQDACVISYATPARCKLLATCGGENGAVRAVLLDSDSQRLVAVDWLPGRVLKAERTELGRALPAEIHRGSLAQHRLVVSDFDGRVSAVNCNTGSVSPIDNLATPAVLAPDGRTLIAATDRGLVTMTLWGEVNAAIIPGDIEPLAVTALDASSMAVVPGEDDDHFQVAVGCYGWVEMVRVLMERAREGVPWLPAENRAISTPLPTDPHDIVNAAAIGPLAPGAKVFVVDEGRCGLIAIDPGTDQVAAYPTESKGYGTVRRALPSLDWTACLVTLADGSVRLWLPESPDEGRRVKHSARRIVLWQGECALVMDEDRAVLREASLRAL